MSTSRRRETARQFAKAAGEKEKGKAFLESAAKNESAALPLNGVIRCWPRLGHWPLVSGLS